MSIENTLERIANALEAIANNQIQRNLGERPEETKKRRTRRVEPVAAEPVAAEPVAAEPVAAEPVAVEPVAVEPVAVEPVAVEPVAVEQAEPVLTPTSPAPEQETIREDITFRDVSQAFFGICGKYRNKYGMEATRKHTSRLLTKYAGGKPMSESTVPVENYAPFLAELKQLEGEI